MRLVDAACAGAARGWGGGGGSAVGFGSSLSLRVPLDEHPHSGPPPSSALAHPPPDCAVLGDAVVHGVRPHPLGGGGRGGRRVLLGDGGVVAEAVALQDVALLRVEDEVRGAEADDLLQRDARGLHCMEPRAAQQAGSIGRQLGSEVDCALCACAACCGEGSCARLAPAYLVEPGPGAHNLSHVGAGDVVDGVRGNLCKREEGERGERRGWELTSAGRQQQRRGA